MSGKDNDCPATTVSTLKVKFSYCLAEYFNAKGAKFYPAAAGQRFKDNFANFFKGAKAKD
jgi:hypothetical protein